MCGLPRQPKPICGWSSVRKKRMFGRDRAAAEAAFQADPVGVPFHHLVLVAQIARFDVDRTLALLERAVS